MPQAMLIAWIVCDVDVFVDEVGFAASGSIDEQHCLCWTAVALIRKYRIFSSYKLTPMRDAFYLHH